MHLELIFITGNCVQKINIELRRPSILKIYNIDMVSLKQIGLTHYTYSVNAHIQLIFFRFSFPFYSLNGAKMMANT